MPQGTSSLDALLSFANPAALRHLGQSAARRKQQEYDYDSDSVVTDDGPGFMGLSKPRNLLVTGDMRRRWDAEDTARKGTEVGFQLAEQYEPANAARQASIARDITAPAQDDIADLLSRGEARRYFGSGQEAMRNDQHGRRMELATEPARVAAGGRMGLEGVKGQNALNVALARRDSPADIVAAQLDDWMRAGVFGFDRRGNPNPPPPNATQVLEQLMGSALRGGGQPGGAPGAAPGMAPGGADGAKTISRQQLQAAVSAGEFSSLAEAEEYARVTGYTVR
jgi:hypothetical protein